jgi:CRP-like cAMP-binding protein
MALEDDMALLSRVSVFAGMDRDALRLLAFSAELRHLRAGDTLFHKGDLSDGGFVVVKGTIAMVEDDRRAADAVVGPGTLIGEVALITETKRPATAVAREPTTVVRLSRAMFRRTLEEYPQLAGRLASELSQRVKSMSKDLSEVRSVLDPGERKGSK